MILQTRGAKIILSLMAVILLACAVFVAVTGWDGSTDTYVSTSASEGATTPILPATEKVQPPLPPTPPDPAPVVPISGVYIDPQHSETRSGEQVSVNLTAAFAGCGISGCEVVLEFDPAVFQLIDVVSGNLLGGDPLIGTKYIDNTAGKVRFAIARKGLTEMTDSNGILSTFSLQLVNSAGTGPHDLTIGDIILTDHDFKEMAGYETHSGSVEVLP